MALTPAESEFAARQHRLVFSFLIMKNLDVKDWYDVVAFGYLAAVQQYLARPGLQRYAFSTIAWRRMARSVSNELRAQARQKRHAQTISLSQPLTADDEQAIETWLADKNDVVQQLQYELLMLDLMRRVTKKQRKIIRLRIAGYNTRDIARALNMSIRDVSAMLSATYKVAIDVCYGET